MATAGRSDLQMRQSDLIKKEPLDYGGFGEVYLCYHVTLGQVVMKTMYTGQLRNEKSKVSLLEEGKVMASLNHERVVKLLGVIMEDKDCSLVMELIPRGNLSTMLESVNVHVPISIKGRIMVEILEGMIYLTKRGIIHKDIKPENILIDKEFHIKIADLGLAICQTWTKLTKKESCRKINKSKSTGARGAGTLSYMAPEHLESVHTASTEKSDVYSFAIVVWVILTTKEPYENARNEDHVSLCVRNGERPLEGLIPHDTPVEIIELMKMCWDQDPQKRPTFSDAYSTLFPFYMKHLEPSVEKDVAYLKSLYEGPDDLIEKIKLLSVTSGDLYTDYPASLVSSERSAPDPVEASIEDLHAIECELSVQSTESHIQTDAKVRSCHLPLERKLDRELHYHTHGSYTSEDQPDFAPFCHPNYSNPFLSHQFSNPDTKHNDQDQRGCVSSVHTWTSAQFASQEKSYSAADLYESLTSSTPPPSHLHMSTSSPSLPLNNQQHPHSTFDRQQSYPTFSASDTCAPDMGHHLATSKKGPTQDSAASLFIQNAHGIQIGNNNKLSITALESSHSSSSLMTMSPFKEAIQKYEDHAVTEEHLDLLRKNIGASWKQCARRLNLSDVEIDTINHDFYRDGLPEMVHQMLQRWKMKGGSVGCTVGKLCRALEGYIKVDLIQKLLDTCSSST